MLCIAIVPSSLAINKYPLSPSLFVETYKGTSGKIDGLLSLIKEYIGSGHRILLFSQFVQALNSFKAVIPVMRGVNSTVDRSQTRSPQSKM